MNDLVVVEGTESIIAHASSKGAGMVGLRNSLEKELVHLLELKNILKKRSNQDYGDKSLRVSSSSGLPRYYVRDKNGKYTYLKKEERQIAAEIAQFEYEQRLEKLIKRRIVQIQKILKTYSDFEIDAMYEAEIPHRKALLVPIEETWEQKFERWNQMQYQGKEFAPGTPVIMTEKGERVRSKSEKILADYFLHKGIPYKYEKPLRLSGFGVVHPDFTFLSPVRQVEVYLEHNGLMDNPEYASKAVRKIDAYIKNGIIPGDRLILTYETSQYPVSMDCVEKLLRPFFEF